MFEKIKQKNFLNEKLGKFGSYEILANGKILCKLDEKKLEKCLDNRTDNKYILRLPTLFEIKKNDIFDSLNLLSIEYEISNILFDKDTYIYSDSDTILIIKDCKFNGFAYVRCGSLNFIDDIKFKDGVFVDSAIDINFFNSKLSYKGDIEKNFFFISPCTNIYNSKINLHNSYFKITCPNNVSIKIDSSKIFCKTIYMKAKNINEFNSKITATKNSIIKCDNLEVLTKIEAPSIKYNNFILKQDNIETIKLRLKLVRVLKSILLELQIIPQNFERNLENQKTKRFLYKKKDKSRYN